MKTTDLTCIGCPMGCSLVVEQDEKNAEIISVSGNTCKRGDTYARKEVTSPTRIVTSTIAVIGGDIQRVSVKTKRDIPKNMIMDVMKAIRKIKVRAPVKTGDVLESNIAGTGSELVATKDIVIVH